MLYDWQNQEIAQNGPQMIGGRGLYECCPCSLLMSWSTSSVQVMGTSNNTVTSHGRRLSAIKSGNAAWRHLDAPRACKTRPSKNVIGNSLCGVSDRKTFCEANSCRDKKHGPYFDPCCFALAVIPHPIRIRKKCGYPRNSIRGYISSYSTSARRWDDS